MSKADFKLQIERLQQQFDSLVNENKSLNDKVDSLQQAMNDPIANFHSIMLQEPSLEGTSVSLQASYWGALLFMAMLSIVLSIVSLWAIWRFFMSLQCSEGNFLSFFKKRWWILPLLFVGWWLVIFYWPWFLVITAVSITGYGVYRLFKKKTDKSMIDKNLTVNWEDESSFSSNNKEDSQPIKVAALPCIAAVATDTRKPKNQDGYCEAYVEKHQARIIAIADGVGSSFNAEKGSRLVTAKAVELVKNALEKNGTVNFNSIFDKIQIDFDSIFNQVQEELDAEVEREYTDEHQLADLKPASYGTTLIIGIDLPDRFIAAYVGNGSIWHVSGLFNTFPSVVSLPWNAVNLLTPDTIMSSGKEALYKIFFYKGERKHHKPTVLQLSKLDESPGDIFILTTDGVYSSDHAIAAKDEEGEIWIPSTTQFGLLNDTLKEYVEGKEDINDDTLKQLLVRYLAHIKEAKIMDDDTTLAVFISNEAKEHFVKKRLKDETN